jgi:hypothetical protein
MADVHDCDAPDGEGALSRALALHGVSEAKAKEIEQRAL